MKDGLEAVLNATEEQKEALGTQRTPHEIAHQPASWRRTHQIFVEQKHGVRQFLSESGLARTARSVESFLA